MNNKSSTVYALLFVVVAFAIEYAVVGSVAFSLVPLFIGGFVLWWLTTRRTPVDPHKIIIPYLLTVIAFIAHVCEEYVAEIGGFANVLASTPLAHITLQSMLKFAATLAPILWLTGAIMLLRRWPVGYFVANTFLFGMMFIEPTHFLAPFLQDGTFHYVGGMRTALLPITLGWYTFSRLRHELRASKQTAGGNTKS